MLSHFFDSLGGPLETSDLQTAGYEAFRRYLPLRDHGVKWEEWVDVWTSLVVYLARSLTQQESPVIVKLVELLVHTADDKSWEANNKKVSLVGCGPAE